MSEQVPGWLQPLCDLLDQRAVSWSMPTPHTAAATASVPADLSLIVDGPVSSVLDVIGELCQHELEIRVAHWLVRDGQRARIVLVRVVDGQTTDQAILEVRASEVVPTSRTWGRGRRRSLANGGVNVAIYGPDGVGKSSVAAALAASLRNLGVPAPAVRTYHAFVDTDELTVRAESTATAVKASAYGRAAHPRLRASVLVVAYLKRLLLLLLEIRPWIRGGGIAVHDRYLLDVFLKSQKTQPDLMPVLESLLPRFAPSDDLVFVLRADPEVVSARTGELEPAEVLAAYALLDRCLSRSRCAHRDVDANLEAEAVRSRLVQAVLDRQTQRFLARREGSAA